MKNQKNRPQEDDLIVCKGEPLHYQGRDYQTADILNNGTHQVWLAENLAVEFYNDGSPIVQANDPEIWKTHDSVGKYCDYEMNPARSLIYGKLYNWVVILGGNICPPGWHVPTMDEWMTLVSIYGGMCGKLKSDRYWKAPNAGATNGSLFNALPGGSRSSNGEFDKIEKQGFWWSSTMATSQQARCFKLYYDLPCGYIFNAGLQYGKSIRMIKNP